VWRGKSNGAGIGVVGDPLPGSDIRNPLFRFRPLCAHAGYPGAFSSSSEADIAVLDVVDREGGNLPFIRASLNGEVVPQSDIH
jgi:hypothetical protein